MGGSHQKREVGSRQELDKLKDYAGREELLSQHQPSNWIADAAKRVSQLAVTRINEAVVAAGGPDNVVVTVAEPNIETAQKLFRYPGINLLVVTGGEAVVNEARKHTDKRLIAAGAGNPPVVVDDTADIARAARDIVFGASFRTVAARTICSGSSFKIPVALMCRQACGPISAFQCCRVASRTPYCSR